MLELLDLLRFLGILAVTFFCYISIFHRSVKQTGFYKKADWNHFFKKWLAKRKLDEIKFSQRNKLMNKLKRNKTEKPLVLKNESSSDCQKFYGTDQNGNSLLIGMTRLRHRNAEMWLILKLKNGEIWTLPGQPNSRVYDVTTGKFKTSELEFECLQPFSRWRITFKGYLRKGICTEYLSAINEENLEYVKFNFFFNASNKPLFWPIDWSSNLMAHSVSVEKWKDGSWPEILNIPGNGGYDQFGEIYGQIFLPDCEPMELHLPGLRQRRWEAFHRFNLRKSCSIFGITRKGCVFTIGANSFHKNLSHAQFGNIRFSDGEIYPIDSTNFHIENFLKAGEDPPNPTSVYFNANGRNFKTFLNLKKLNEVVFLEGRPLSWNTSIIPFDFTLNSDTGFGIVISCSLNKSIPQEYQPPERLNKVMYNNSLSSDSRLTVMFEDYDAHSKLVSGGKGASLALLTSISNQLHAPYYNFHVAPGFILSSSALRLFLTENKGIYLELRNLEDICNGRLQGSLEAVCVNITQLFVGSNLSEKLIDSIKKSLTEIELRNNTVKKYSFAVRSSGIEEDGTKSSSAGQNESFLGLQEIGEILNCIKKCWASQYCLKSVSYRRLHGQPILSEMAVVVQVMINSESSGVLFTNHSISKKSLNSVISANFGLGESVVSGMVEPDTYILKRNHNEKKIKIEEIIIGDKSHSISLKQNGGVEKVEYKSNKIQCLSNEIILALGEIGLVLEEMFGSPQDIEWAVYKNEIYILQTRPITTLKEFTDWEYLHELDSPIMTTNTCFTRGNVGEVFPGPVDYLTQSIILYSLDGAQKKSIRENFYDLLINNGLLTSHNFLFINLLAMYKKIFKEGKVTLREKVSIFGLLGSLEINEEIKRAAIDQFGCSDLKQSIKVFKTILPKLYTMSASTICSSNFVKIFKEMHSDDSLKKYKSPIELYDKIIEITDNHFDFVMDNHIISSSSSSFLQSIILRTIIGKSDELSPDHIRDTMKILTGESEIVSVDIPKKLDEIANVIYLSGCDKAFRKIEPKDSAKWLENNCYDAFKLYEIFIKIYGHRCIREFEFRSKPWEMNTEQVLKMIQENLKVTHSNGREHIGDVDEVVNTLKTQSNKIISRFILRKLAPYCRQAVKNRESTKNSLVLFIHIVRKHIIRLSELLVLEGQLPEKDLIYFMTKQELGKLIKSREKSIFIHKAFQRRKLSLKWEQLKFPDTINKRPSPLVFSLKYKLKEGDKIKGLPVQSGCTEGRACVLSNIADVHLIEAGDILITTSTDIAWSPYFPLLGGLVTELGGLISHGAVVAREYGLPCLVGAQNATCLLKFGDKILLNADEGYVTKI